MAIAVTCPNCKASYKLPDELAGKKVKCQKCDAAVSVPGGSSAISAKPTAVAKSTKVKAGNANPKAKTPAGDGDDFSFDEPSKTPSKPKKSGGCALVIILVLLGGGLLGCVGCVGGGAWLFLASEVVEVKGGGPIAFADKKDDVIKVEIKKDAKLDGPKKDGVKADGPKKDDGIKDKPPLDGKKDDGKKDDGKKDDGVKDKGGPAPDGKKDGPQPKDKKVLTPAIARDVIFGKDGVYRSDDILTNIDTLTGENARHKQYFANLEAGGMYHIELASKDFSTYLFLRDDAGKLIDEDSGGKREAVLMFQPKRTAKYRIDAATLDKPGYGQYTLIVKRTDVAVVKDKDPPVPSRDHVVFGADGTFTAQAEVEPGAPQGLHKERYRPYTADLVAGTTYQIELARQGSLSILLAVAEDGGKKNLMDSDTGQQASYAVLMFRPKVSGRYQIQAYDQKFAKSKFPQPFTLTVKRCENLVIAKDFRVTYHIAALQNLSGAIGGGRVVHDPVWASDGNSFYVMTEEGVLRQIDLATGDTKQQIAYLRRCKSMAMSGAGLLLAFEDNKEVWVMDPADIKEPKARIPIGGVTRLASGADAKFAVACIRQQGFDLDGLAVLDLQKGTVTGRLGRRQDAFVRMSRDGRFVFAAATNEPLARFRCNGVNLFLEETSNYIVEVPHDINICPDQPLVWYQGGRAKSAPEAAVFHWGNLKKPLFTIPAPKDRAVEVAAVDPKTGYFYCIDDNHHLLVHTPGGAQRASLRIPRFEASAREGIIVGPNGGEMLLRGHFDVAYVKINTPGEALAKLDPIKADPKFDPKVDPKVDPKKDPGKEPPKAGSITAKNVTFRVFPFLPGLKGMPNGPVKHPAWANDGKSFYMLSMNGALQRINVDTYAVDKSTMLQRNPDLESTLAMSGDGLVVAHPTDRQVLVLDPEDLATVKRKLTIPDLLRISVSQDTNLAIAATSTGKGGGVRLVDLEKAELGPMIPFKISTTGLRISADGKYVFFTDAGKILRYRVDYPKLTFEEMSPAFVFAPASLHLSHDGQTIGIAGAVTAPPNDNPVRGVRILPIDNLKKPTAILGKVEFPRAIGIDSRGGWIFANDTKKPLMIFNMAGVKQCDVVIPEIDAQTVTEIRPSPLGNAAVFRTANSVVLVKIDAPASGPTGKGTP